MSGKYKEVQAIIKDENHLARFIPCCSHSLNLVGVNATCSNVSAKNFFGTIQTLFNFFFLLNNEMGETNVNYKN